jgi:hypothetical protein
VGAAALIALRFVGEALMALGVVGVTSVTAP